jgi:hypothetical protein
MFTKKAVDDFESHTIKRDEADQYSSGKASEKTLGKLIGYRIKIELDQHRSRNLAEIMGKRLRRRIMTRRTKSVPVLVGWGHIKSDFGRK